MAEKRKRRRRRKVPIEITPDLPSDVDIAKPDDDLPEFDFEEDTTATIEDDILKEAMMGSSPVGISPSELLRSRDISLEKNMEFDDVEKPLPKPGFLGTSSNESSPSVELGKKRARSEARRAAAIEREESLKAEEPLFNQIIKKLPFQLGRNDAGDVTAIKIIELGAWTGITLLILWEFYINSPLFQRSGELIPVVFE